MTTINPSHTISKRLLILCLIFVVLVGCGKKKGGGSNGAPPTITVNPTTVTVSADQSVQIVKTTANDDGSTQLVTTPNSALGKTLAVGSVVQVIDGADPRFPLGLVGKVASVTTEANGVTSAQLTKATLANVVQKSNIQTGEVALDSTNFIGVITPKAVQALEPTNSKPFSALQKGVVALNGGLILREPNLLGQALNKAKGGFGTVDAQEIPIRLGVNLANMGLDPG